MEFELTCSEIDAPLFLRWIHTRGGVAVWRTTNLGDPTQSWSTPALNIEGHPMQKQLPYMEDQPSKIVTDPSKIGVCNDAEVRRFRVAVRMNGMRQELTASSSRRVRAAVKDAGDGAHHTFDYDTQEAIIMAPKTIVPLDEWARLNTLVITP